MKIILISGERGTGKTTISKKVSKELGYAYYSDFEILNGLKTNHNSQNGDDGDNVLINAYKSFFNKHIKENMVIDAETTILPNRIRKLQKEFDIDAVFLGFDGISEGDLIEQLKVKKQNMTLGEIKNQAWGLLDLGKKIKLMCEEENFKFYSINKNRNSVIEILTNNLINRYKNLV